ncbi:hypothetical protein [Pseudarthrobacter sp. BRE9]|uniref:hypothetical protein n=1 Tax=Pseudarthrobacter sp. BRE9 TaxID=2962582 RepID=UPI0028812171|nr:hypothetical protein [Pseudarthrobacter sp. BRE9]MDT0169057.1 hypothetical protein [Pseudarthrobacter sp. BRE9]
MESTQPSALPARISARAWLAGPFATALGLAAHVAGGGQSPALVIVAALVALLSLGAAVLERVVQKRLVRDRLPSAQLPGWAVLVAAAVAQQLLHLAFAAFSTAAAVPLPGHAHGGAPTPDAPSSSGSPAAHSSLHLMLYLHAAAALLAAAAVAQWNRLAGWTGAKAGRT